VKGIVGVVKVESLSMPITRLLKKRKNALSVDRLIGRRIKPNHFQKSGKAIRADDGRTTGAVCLDLPGPANDPGNANPALVEHSLEPTEGSIVSVVTTVVRFEKNEGVFPEASFVESLKKAADLGIHSFDHGRVNRIFDPRPLALFIFGNEILLGFDRIVYGVGPPVEIKAFFLILFDELDRFVGKSLGKVFALFLFRESRDFIRSKIGRRTPTITAPDIQIKTLLIWAKI
jgi:hypothetical protein